MTLYESLSDAARAIGALVCNIQRAAANRNRKCLGYRVYYHDSARLPQLPIIEAVPVPPVCRPECETMPQQSEPTIPKRRRRQTDCMEWPKPLLKK